jgi:hypothetical protein
VLRKGSKRQRAKVVRRHEHRSVLRGEMRRRAKRLGQPTMFVWECDDPACLRTHTFAPPKR